MAQTKRRRQTKHRGNAAGAVESRGRTGRKPRPEEKGAKGKGAGKTGKAGGQPRKHRLDEPPTWRSATIRSLLAAAFVFFAGVLFLRFKLGQALILMPIVLLFYIPIGYYTDLWLYRRRQRQKAQKSGSRP